MACYSDYYLHGFERMTPALKRLIVTSSLCSYPADAFLLEALEDDRLAMRISVFEESVMEEVEFVAALADDFWHRLAGICECEPRSLKSACIEGCLVSEAF